MTRIVVAFKHEGEDRGIPFGPVYVIDKDEADKDPRTSIPFGEPLPGVTEMGWLPKPQAIEIAEQYGVELEEA